MLPCQKAVRYLVVSGSEYSASLFFFGTRRKSEPPDLRLEISHPKSLREFLRFIPMNAEMLRNLLNTEVFLCRFWQREDQLRQTRCDETQLEETIHTFPRFHLIPIEAEVLFCVPKCGLYLPPLAIVFKDLRDLKRQIGCKNTKIAIRL